MNQVAIGEASARLGVSARALRYYEQLGLVRSERDARSGYRYYGADAIARIGRIVALRKLRLSLGEIGAILSSESAVPAIEALEGALARVEGEMDSLGRIRAALRALLSGLRSRESRLLSDADLEGAANALSLSRALSEEAIGMGETGDSAITPGKLTDDEVRIVCLPPSWVASSHYIGDEPEHHAAEVMDRFVVDSGLADIKPDLRSYGFNHPNPGRIEGSDAHGYEFWVTIPDDMDVPAPLERKRFEGGLYAARMIPMGAFEEWGRLWDWSQTSAKYAPNTLDDGGECMNGLLEECLNYRNRVASIEGGVYDEVQLDLLLPVKPRA